MVNRFYFAVFLCLALISANSTVAPVEAGLLKDEGGCVFTTEKGYPPFMLEFAGLSDLEKTFAPDSSVQEKDFGQPVAKIFENSFFSIPDGKKGKETGSWEKPTRVISEHLATIFNPAVAAQLKKAGALRKVKFSVGEDGSIATGSIFLAGNRLLMTIDKIRSKPRFVEANGAKIFAWKLVVEPPVKFMKDGGNLSQRVYYEIGR